MEDSSLEQWYSEDGRCPIKRLTEHALKRNPDLFNTEYSKSNNKERLREYVREWRERNPLSSSMSSAIRSSLFGRKSNIHWEALVDYNLSKLKRHIQKQFVGGMSWDNYGEWELDHIIPVSAFAFTSKDDIDFKRCWALKNLRPLWRKDNRSKGNKITEPFQPSLQTTLSMSNPRTKNL